MCLEQAFSRRRLQYELLLVLSAVTACTGSFNSAQDDKYLELKRKEPLYGLFECIRHAQDRALGKMLPKDLHTDGKLFLCLANWNRNPGNTS
jgi:hypothetical protein